MRLKHFLYWLTILSALYQIGISVYARVWDGEIETAQGMISIKSDRELYLTYSLNLAMPAGVLAMLLLLYIRKVDGVSGFGMLTALVLHVAAVDMSFRAVDTVYGERPPMTALAWWAPDNFM